MLMIIYFPRIILSESENRHVEDAVSTIQSFTKTQRHKTASNFDQSISNYDF